MGEITTLENNHPTVGDPADVISFDTAAQNVVKNPRVTVFTPKDWWILVGFLTFVVAGYAVFLMSIGWSLIDFLFVVIFAAVCLCPTKATVLGSNKFGEISATGDRVFTPLPPLKGKSVKTIKSAAGAGEYRQELWGRISARPDVWTQYVYYQHMADTISRIIRRKPANTLTPVPLEERKRWYEQQATTAYNQLFEGTNGASQKYTSHLVPFIFNDH